MAQAIPKGEQLTYIQCCNFASKEKFTSDFPTDRHAINMIPIS